MPSMDYTVEKDGQTDVVDDNHVMNEFRNMGYPIQGVSADGLHMIMQGPAGPKGQPGEMQKVPIHAALQQAGFKVHSAHPTAADAETIEPMLGGMVNTMPEDNNMRRAYIEHTLKSRGINEPIVTGEGNKWHVFNPSTNQWAQLTDEPGMNMSGLAAAGLALPHMLGGAIGGAGGLAAGSGLASIPMAMGGAALGSAAGSGLERAALAGIDPSYRAAMHGHMNEVLSDVAETAGLDALGEGIAAPLIKGLPLKQAANLAGSALEGTGGLVSRGTKAVLDSPALTSLASDFNPIDAISGLTFGGQIAQAPAEAVKLGAKIPGRLAQSPITGPLFAEETRAGMEGLSHALGAQSQSAENILGSAVGGRAQRAAAEYAADSAAREQEQAAAQAAKEYAGKFGITEPSQLEEIGQGMAGDYKSKELAQRLQSMGAEENWGSDVGRILDQLHAAGRGAEALGTQATRAGLRGLQGLGQITRMTGKAIPPATEALRYGGLPWAARYGLLPRFSDVIDEMRKNP